MTRQYGPVFQDVTKVSVYTPTHDLQFFMAAYNSLKAQTYNNWELVVQPNGAVKKENFPDEIQKDPKVVFCPYVVGVSVGVLKGLCVQNCTGELFVELDHDDYLTPDALRKIVDVYLENGSKEAFIFSDCVHFFPDDTSEVFPVTSGWKHYDVEHGDKKYTVMSTFEPTPRALCEIFWSPNHVRCWSRSAYQKTGGYDMSLKVADDHDLMVRTYLAGVNFYHIPDALYFYRRYPGNTFVRFNAEVQAQQGYNRDKYIYQLWGEWCRRKKLLMIDLGGAFNCPKDEGFKSVDMHNPAGANVDYVCDVTQKDKLDKHFTNNSIGLIRAVDFLEHIPIGKVVPLMNNLYRKLAPGGLLASMTPSVRGPDGSVGCGAYQDPTHVSFWSENNFWYFTRKSQAQYIPQFAGRFQAVRLWTDWPTEHHKKNFIPYIHADLMKVKGDERVPGELYI